MSGFARSIGVAVWVLCGVVSGCPNSLASETGATRTGRAESYTVEPDGSLRLGRPGAELVFRFGLATNSSLKVWRDGPVLRRQWTTNGVRYTQTVFVHRHPLPDGKSSAMTVSGREVLLVNIQGENTNAEYAEASAALECEAGGRRQLLELKAGQILGLQAGSRKLLAALDIPDPGVKTARGDRLQFQGNMPPSEKGSLTLKIPLQETSGEDAGECLSEIDFVEALAKALKNRD